MPKKDLREKAAHARTTEHQAWQAWQKAAEERRRLERELAAEILAARHQAVTG